MEFQSASKVIPRQISPRTVMVVDDEPGIREICRRVAVECGLRVLSAETTDRALALLEQHPVDIVLSDLKVPQTGGIELLRRIRSSARSVPFMILTQDAAIESSIEATKLDVCNYVTKPVHVDDLQSKLMRIVRELEHNDENRLFQEHLRAGPGFGGLIGISRKMQELYKMIQRVSHHTFPILILGESGTGKELVARSIHLNGPRKHMPFIPIDCSSLVPTLIESELFGHVKGAFTGATQGKRGLLEGAQGGTLFLDEIGDMPVDLQAKLLRVLQEHEFRPVGSTERISVDTRVIAATNRNLETAIREGRFRQDLYFRLNVVQIILSPLRERKTDIPLLLRFFLKEFSEPQRPEPTIPEDVMANLMAYSWPGNVREVENVVQRAIALGSASDLYFEDLPSNPKRALDQENLLPLREIEHRAIERALQETCGNRNNAARLLGIGKSTLYRKLGGM
jgi:two-component system response regulator HydG